MLNPTTTARPHGLGKHQLGQSLVELIIWGAVFMIALFAVPMIIKTADIKNKHYEAVRYGVWERTVWTTSAKSNDQLRTEIDTRVMGHPSQALTQADRGSNPFWSHRGRTILDGEENGTNIQMVDIDDRRSPRGSSLVAGLAHDGAAFGEDLGLNGRGYATMEVSTGFLDRFDENRDHRYELDNPSSTYAMVTEGSILSDQWSVSLDRPPQNDAEVQALGDLLESEYQGTVGGLVQPVKTATEIVTFTGDLAADFFFPGSEKLFIGEGNDSGEVTIATYSDVVDDKYLKDK